MCGFLAGQIKWNRSRLMSSFEKIAYRGPDAKRSIELADDIFLGFHRLAIMDLTDHGDQPFTLGDSYLLCNGEIYNHKQIRSKLLSTYHFQSDSDCEVILPLIKKIGLFNAVKELDGEFAFVLYDQKLNKFLAARDHMGIRPMFYGKDKESGEYVFASEAKALISHCTEITPFPPGHLFDGEKFLPFAIQETITTFHLESKESILKGIRERLISAVEKRLDSDAPIGFMLSGGLDSSLVCSIATRVLGKKITTFAVGINENPIDAKYAKQVAAYLGANHHEYLFKKNDIFRTLRDLIYRLETYDITTIRASMGMNLLCEYIKAKTDVKVVFTGEVSDELFGYKYTDFAPSPEAFQQEAKKRVDELYMYDVLRADRCISSNSLEARVPFSDKEFVDYVMRIDPALKMNTTGIGKYLLRAAFKDQNYLEDSILYREKAAFSDAVGHSVVDYLKEYADSLYSDKELLMAKIKYPHATPLTKEALMYRNIFEEHFSGMSYLVKDFWLPNRSWKNCDVIDPSARVLPNYGASGV